MTAGCDLSGRRSFVQQASHTELLSCSQHGIFFVLQSPIALVSAHCAWGVWAARCYQQVLTVCLHPCMVPLSAQSIGRCICAPIRCRQLHALVCSFPSRWCVLHRLGVPVLQAAGCSCCVAESPAVSAYLLSRRARTLCCPMLCGVWLRAQFCHCCSWVFAPIIIRSELPHSDFRSCFCPDLCLALPPGAWRQRQAVGFAWAKGSAERGLLGASALAGNGEGRVNRSHWGLWAG